MFLVYGPIDERLNPHRMRHVHPGAELLVVEEGTGIQLTGQGEEPCAKDDIYLFPPGCWHMGFANPGQRFACVVLQTGPEDLVGGMRLLSVLTESAQTSNHMQVRPATGAKVRRLLRQALDEWQGDQPGGRCAAEALVLETLVSILRDPRFGQTDLVDSDDPGARHVAVAARWLADHWMSPVRIEDLVALGRLGRSQFLARFRAIQGCSVGDMLLRQRIEAAKRLLSEDRHALADIALMCGFAHQSHFTRAFRAVTGMPPGRWRDQGQPP